MSTAEKLPYLASNKNLPELFSQIQAAAVPDRFTFEFLKRLGLTSSNDRAYPSLLKRLGFLDPSGVPTERYRLYKDRSMAPGVMAQAIRELYAEVFAVNENVYRESREVIKGIIARVSGNDERYVNLTLSTFMALCALANFESASAPAVAKGGPPDTEAEDEPEKPAAASIKARKPSELSLAFRHNIEIHLPATTDIAVYNAIFKSLREHLAS